MQDQLIKKHFQAMGEDGSYAAYYGKRDFQTHAFFARRDRVQEFLAQRLRPGQRVLDVGCGPGPMVEFFCSRGLTYCGVDVAQSMLDTIANQFSNTQYWSNIELKSGSCDYIPYPDSSFDVFVGMGLLEYLDDMQGTLNEIRRLLKPQGLAVLTIPNLLGLNRLIMRNTGFITALYHTCNGRSSPHTKHIVRKELAPSALDHAMANVGLMAVGRAFYEYKFICYPINRLFPKFAYLVNRLLENRAPYFLANGYIGFYEKICSIGLEVDH